jgi:hypothetical protein
MSFFDCGYLDGAGDLLASLGMTCLAWAPAGVLWPDDSDSVDPQVGDRLPLSAATGLSRQPAALGEAVYLLV